MSAGITSTIRLAIRTLPENFDHSRIVAVIESIEQELYEGGVYASATADSMTIEITVLCAHSGRRAGKAVFHARQSNALDPGDG